MQNENLNVEKDGVKDTLRTTVELQLSRALQDSGHEIFISMQDISRAT